MKPIHLAIWAVVTATIITTTMDFTGYILYSAFPLIAITIIFWRINKLSKQEFGLSFGKPIHYFLALLYPLIIVGITLGITYFLGYLEMGNVRTERFLVDATIGTFMVLITEEGFFRGWLWGTLKRANLSTRNILIFTSLAFTVWHISAVVSGTEYGLPPRQVPVYLVNAILLGLNWGMLRWISGSVIVPAFCHAIWNGIVYELFAYGEKVGSSGIVNTIIFAPEVGILGIFLNGMFFISLWLYAQRKKLNDNH